MIRPELSGTINRIVIKLGSLSVTHEDGKLNLTNIKSFVEDIGQLLQTNPNSEIIIVTSGAINAGKPFLNYNSSAEKKEIRFKQAASAIGQPLLMHTYAELFKEQNLSVAQILLIHDDIKNKERYLNTKNCLQTLMQNKIIPIINENDSVSFEEISVGDNDNLAIMVAELVNADLLLFFTEADGLFTKNPKELDAKKFETIISENFKVDDIDLSTKTSVGRGGMRSKFDSIKKINQLGITVIIATYERAHPIIASLSSKVGTVFLPYTKKIKKRKSRLLTTIKKNSAIVIDNGAWTALKSNASLLAIGIKEIRGQFRRGDTIAIEINKSVVASGLVEYDSFEMKKIMGQKSNNFKNYIDNYHSDVIIHKDNLILLEP